MCCNGSRIWLIRYARLCAAVCPAMLQDGLPMARVCVLWHVSHTRHLLWLHRCPSPCPCLFLLLWFSLATSTALASACLYDPVLVQQVSYSLINCNYQVAIIDPQHISRKGVVKINSQRFSASYNASKLVKFDGQFSNCLHFKFLVESWICSCVHS